MLGLTERELFSTIDGEVLGAAYSAVHIKDQQALHPQDILRKLASGVAKAIEANNKAIESQLRSAGIKL